jgi:hypothetical protein
MTCFGRRSLSACLPALVALLVCGVGSADAARVRLHAVPGGRLAVRLAGPGASGSHVFVLDGRRVVRSRRRVIRLRVWRQRSSPVVRWRRLVVRRARSERLVARARFAVGASRARLTPTLVLLRVRAGGRAVVLELSVSDRVARCRVDGEGWRRCAGRVRFGGLATGPHRFVVRAANRHGVTIIRLVRTISAPAPPLAPPTGPPGAKLVFADDFGGRAVNTAAWSLYDSAGNAGHGLQRPSAVGVDGAGHLVITAQTTGGELVSGGMSNRYSVTYGWFQFRVRTEPDPTGTMSGVVLTWPDSGRWPIDGENDIYETGAAPSTRNPFHSYVHYGSDNRQYRFTYDSDGSQWHTMAMDWRPHAIRFYLDGRLAGAITDSAAIPHSAHHLAIQLDARRDGTLSRQVRMYVDYARVYRY